MSREIYALEKAELLALLGKIHQLGFQEGIDKPYPHFTEKPLNEFLPSPVKVLTEEEVSDKCPYGSNMLDGAYIDGYNACLSDLGLK